MRIRTYVSVRSTNAPKYTPWSRTVGFGKGEMVTWGAALRGANAPPPDSTESIGLKIRVGLATTDNDGRWRTTTGDSDGRRDDGPQKTDNDGRRRIGSFIEGVVPNFPYLNQATPTYTDPHRRKPTSIDLNRPPPPPKCAPCSHTVNSASRHRRPCCHIATLPSP